MSTRRWSPGRGFIKLQEYGDHAVWMKPLRDGALLAAYVPGWDRAGGEHHEKWILELPRGTDFHWDILDKIHRIRWILREETIEIGSTLWGVKILKYEWCNPSHREVKTQPRRVWGSWHRGFKHMWSERRRRPWEGERGMEPRTNMPRKILSALEPHHKQLVEIEMWRQQTWDKWQAQEQLTSPEVVGLARSLLPMDGFHEEDEPIADVIAAYERGEKGVMEREEAGHGQSQEA